MEKWVFWHLVNAGANKRYTSKSLLRRNESNLTSLLIWPGAPFQQKRVVVLSAALEGSMILSLWSNSKVIRQNQHVYIFWDNFKGFFANKLSNKYFSFTISRRENPILHLKKLVILPLKVICHFPFINDFVMVFAIFSTFLFFPIFFLLN